MMLLSFIQEQPMNNAIAAGAITSPWWLTGLQHLSEGAAMLLPVAGVLWFAVQIYFHIKNKGKR